MLFYAALFSLVLQPTPEASGELASALEIGTQEVTLQHTLPLLNQVVLVPDEATYLDELSKWSPDARWPVLFDDNRFAPMFIRRFQPQVVWRRSPVGKPIDDFELSANSAIAKAWGGNQSPNTAFLDLDMTPTGLVVTNKNDRARIAAVALAAGRGQRLSFVNDWPNTTTTWDTSQTEQYMQDIEELANSFGSTISTITVCMTMSPRANFLGAKENPIATTDLIGRSKNGIRYAWCGWVFGSQKRSAYTAACSLFLPRTAYWFCNTYPDDGIWGNYGPKNLQELLPSIGVSLTETAGALDDLLEIATGGVWADAIFFTSKGNKDFLELTDTRVAPTWLPILNTPAILQFVHSWSLKNPDIRTTVGGTWLDRGVYAYVGSSHEPMLQAFVPPVEVIRRTSNLVPFLIASRWFAEQGKIGEPWRINTIGDPRMVCGLSGVTNRSRVAAVVRPEYTNVVDQAKLYVEQVVTSPSDEFFSKAIELATLIGRDKIALQLWNNANKEGVADTLTSRASLPALFRAKAHKPFLWAFRKVPSPNRFERDMLWQLASLFPDSAVDVLVENVRGVYACDDLRILAPTIAKTRGNAAVLSIINKYITGARGRNERELKKMRKQYGG
ncbi:MAG: hypothetical protein QGI78_01145 [Phycisphaerales bacterium]|jgi:hypothetical protein|nr:hypothetical protein [Phycisphaerales bacterium]